jgi:hypothetical protein
LCWKAYNITVRRGRIEVLRSGILTAWQLCRCRQSLTVEALGWTEFGLSVLTLVATCLWVHGSRRNFVRHPFVQYALVRLTVSILTAIQFPFCLICMYQYICVIYAAVGFNSSLPGPLLSSLIIDHISVAKFQRATVQ